MLNPQFACGHRPSRSHARPEAEVTCSVAGARWRGVRIGRYREGVRWPRVQLVAMVMLAGLGGGSCSSGSGHSSTTTTVERRFAAHVVGEVVVDPIYRQGVAHVAGGWVFSFNDGLFRTDDALHQTVKLQPAIPGEWRARGFDHIGDIDVEGGVVYAPLEQPNYDRGHQAVLMYDAASLAYKAGVDVAQREASFVTVDAATGIAYSMNRFGGSSLLRYDVRHGWRRLSPLRMSRFVDRVQGADIHAGAAWLSTDDSTDNVYRVDLATGNVQALGSIGHVDGEGEGIDATPVAGVELHVLSIDVAAAPVRLIDLKVAPVG